MSGEFLRDDILRGAEPTPENLQVSLVQRFLTFFLTREWCELSFVLISQLFLIFVQRATEQILEELQKTFETTFVSFYLSLLVFLRFFVL